MRTEIYIEGRRLDLTQDLSVEFTYQIDDIKEFGSRETNFSKTVVLPGSANNNKLFGYVFEFGSQNAYDPFSSNRGYNFNASKAATCFVYVDRIQIMKGVIRLLEIVRDGGKVEYECAIFGELGGFVNALGNAKIESLDFSAYDHLWTLSNITNSWEPTTGVTVSGVTVTGYYPASGYFYPLVDYGGVSAAKADWDFRAFRPALYVKEYLRKIMTGSGYTYESDFFDTALFHRLVIPNNQRDIKKFTSVGFRANADALNYANVGPLSFTIVNTGDFTANAPRTIFTYQSATPFTGTLSVSITGMVIDNTGTFLDFQIRKNGTSIQTISNDPTEGSPISINVSLNNITFAQNDTLSVYVNTDIRGLGFDIDEGQIGYVSATPQFVTVGYGEEIAINDTIPRGVFQRDFFASIVKMFNLYVTESTDIEKHLLIQPYIDFYAYGDVVLATDDFQTIFNVDDTNALLIQPGADEFIDWTYILDRGKPIRLKPMSELNGRYFEYKYKNDIDFYNEQYSKKYGRGYGDYIEDTGYEFAKEQQTAEVIFSATAIVGYPGEDKRVSTVWKLSGTTEDKTEHNIRIHQIKKITGVTSYNIKNGGTTLGSATAYGYGGHLDDPFTPQADILFGTPEELYFTLTGQYPAANLFTGYWFDYVAEITDKDSKLMTAYFKLTEIDIYALDFSKLIYIEGTLWRLNRIIDFNPLNEAPTAVELLKVMELTYE